MFADRTTIIIRSGKGGDGHVSFRREKYVAAGGPDGGDGGKGGDVIFEVDPGMNTLAPYRHKRKYAAENGGDGQKRRRHGKDGEDVILKVPQGTLVLDAASGKLIADLSEPDARVVLLAGGRGGKGNVHFATPTMQVPQYAKPGQDARELEVRLELKLIADVGLVGFPNAGKSTLLRAVSNARPKVADYPFTTLEPMLGVVELEDGDGFVMADIPGLIEGASEGAGLGFEFLRHIERTRLFVHVVDLANLEERDPVEDVKKIDKELLNYRADLADRPRVIAANKVDLLGDGQEENLNALLGGLEDAFSSREVRVFPISAATGEGIRALLNYVREMLSSIPREQMQFVPEVSADELVPIDKDLPFTVTRDEDDPDTFFVEGPRVERMLGYTNLNSEKGFAFFQKFLAENGILAALEEAGVKDGDTIRIYGHAFEYYK